MVYEFWPSILFSSIFGVFIVIVQFIIPVIILLYCYGRIVWVLTRRITSNSQTGDDQIQSTHSDKFQLARANTIKTFLLVAVCFIICWSNNSIYYLMYMLGYDADWNGIYFQFTVLMVFLNCTINPFIYLFKYQDYHMALRNFFSCDKWKEREESDAKPSIISSINSHIWKVHIWN